MSIMKYLNLLKENPKVVIISLFSLLPLVDTVNGYLMTEFNVSIGTIYKMICLFVMIVLFISFKLKMSKRDFLILVGILLYTFVSIVINLLLGGKIIGASFPIKFLYNILMFILLMQLVKYKMIKPRIFYKILDNSSILMIFCILIPYLLNIGYTIYGGGIGYKGFFYSQNELTASLIILLYFSIYNLICALSFKSVFQTIGISACILLTNTKSSMIACAFGLIVLFFEYFRKKDAKYKKIFLGAMFLLLLVSYQFLNSQILGFLQRQLSLSNMYNKSIIATVTSGRSYYVIEAMNNLLSSKVGLLNIIIGNGFCSTVLVEMDFFDMFFFLGIIGLSACLLFVLWLFLNSMQNFKTDYTIVRIVGFFMVVAFSFFTGHIMFYATSGCYFVILCLFDLYYKTPERN